MYRAKRTSSSPIPGVGDGIHPGGFSGCGVWVPTDSRGNLVWSADPLLIGVVHSSADRRDEVALCRHDNTCLESISELWFQDTLVTINAHVSGNDSRLMQWSKPSNADTRDDLSLLDLTASQQMVDETFSVSST
jgi:hypothetical protein